MIAYTLTSTTITVVVSYTPKVIPSSHPNFKRIVEMVANPNTTEEQIAPLLDIPASIATFTGNQVTVQGGKLYYQGYEVKTSLSRKIIEFINAGDDGLAQPLIAFLNNVQQNPDPRAAADLFDWVQASGLPLTGDGHVLAWKAVRSDYRSIHAPTDIRFDHRVGNTVSMPRSECDDNPGNTCSRGLHFCSADYLKSYAGGGHRVIVVKIHPRDVVAFPRDYQNAKGRACAYQVVGEVPFDQVKTFYPQGSPVYRGFDTVSDPAPVVEQLSSPAVPGRRYRRRNGSEVNIVRYSNKRTRDIVLDSTGRAYFAKNGLKGSTPTSPQDLVADIGVAFAEVGLPLTPGQVWVDRLGRETKVISIGANKIAAVLRDGETFSNELYAATGRAGSGSKSYDCDVLSLLRTETVTERNGRFAVGQTWRSANGQTVKITAVNDPQGRPTFPIRADNGANFTVAGHYYQDRASPADLVTLVSDVA